MTPRGCRWVRPSPKTVLKSGRVLKWQARTAISFHRRQLALDTQASPASRHTQMTDPQCMTAALQPPSIVHPSTMTMKVLAGYGHPRSAPSTLEEHWMIWYAEQEGRYRQNAQAGFPSPSSSLPSTLQSSPLCGWGSLSQGLDTVDTL